LTGGGRRSEFDPNPGEGSRPPFAVVGPTDDSPGTIDDPHSAQYRAVGVTALPHAGHCLPVVVKWILLVLILPSG